MSQPPSIWRRLVRTLTSVLAVMVSLLTFPAWIPLMIGVWIAAAAWRVGRGQSVWLPLATCAAIVLVKRADWSPLLGLLVGVGGVTSLLDSRQLLRGPRRWLAVAALGLSWALFAWDWQRSAHNSRAGTIVFDKTRPIVCLGDSLTHSRYADPPARVVGSVLSAGDVAVARPLVQQ